MWGNALGWCISAVLVAVTVGAVWSLGKANTISPPTEFARDEVSVSTIALPVPPTSVVPATQTDDAAPVYRSAIEAMANDIETYDQFAERGRADAARKLEALNLLVRATPCARMTLFSARPAEIINFDRTKPAFDALVRLGRICDRAAALQLKPGPGGKPDPAAAVRYFDAEFALGGKLFQERLSAEEMHAGIELMHAACAGLTRAAENVDPARASSARTFAAALADLRDKRLQPMLNVVEAFGGPTVYQHAGDLFYLADHAPERVWRVEAIFALGRMRFNIGESDAGVPGRVADQRGAMRVLRRLANDDDPVIATAASASRDMTIEQYRLLGPR